jgi:hypothetical protein
MTVKSLRDTLNGLPSDFDDRHVYFCDSIEQEGNEMVAVESGIYGSLLPDDRDCYLLLGKDVIDLLDVRDPDNKDNPDWVEGQL